MPLSFLTRDFLISLNSEAEANMGSDWLSSSSNICEDENGLKVSNSKLEHLRSETHILDIIDASSLLHLLLFVYLFKCHKDKI